MNNKEKDKFYRKLNRWLDEWELSQELEVDDINIQTTETKHKIPFEEPIYNDIKPGDILLLSSELTSKGRGLIKPLFIAILRLWEKEDSNEFFLWAPYSPFSQAATDKEIQFQNSDSKLSVLSVWNAHTSPKELLSKSWYVGELEDQNRKDALKVFWYSLGMEELTLELEDKVGPKLYNEKDPRHQYLEQELKITEIIRELSIQSLNPEMKHDGDEGDTVLDFVARKDSFENEKPRMSASSKNKKPTRARYENRKLFLVLTVRSIPRKELVMFELDSTKVEGHDRLDEFSVELKEIDEPIKSFRNGECVHQVSLAKISFTLIDPQGKAVELNLLKD